MARSTVTVSLETITPTTAERWLGHNTHNRHVRLSKVEDLAAAMRRGEWDVNGETIKFNGTGKLLDGQHRLLAVVESGVTIRSFVAHNLPSETQQTIDLVHPRKLADELSMQGIPNAIDIAAMVTWVYRYEQHQPRRNSLRPTIKEGLALFARHPGLASSIPYGRAVSGRLGGPRSVHAFLHYHFASIDSEDADAFFTTLATGEGLESGSPILALRRLLETARKKNGATLTVAYRMALFTKAWNVWRNGEEISTLYWRAGGANPEKWPVAQ